MTMMRAIGGAIPTMDRIFEKLQNEESFNQRFILRAKENTREIGKQKKNLKTIIVSVLKKKK